MDVSGLQPFGPGVGLDLGLRPRLLCVGPSALGKAWPSVDGWWRHGCVGLSEDAERGDATNENVPQGLKPPLQTKHLRHG